MLTLRNLVLLASLMLLSACWNPFAPTEGPLDGVVSLTLTEQRNPDEVLQNFRYAYVYRDSLVYSELLDTSFIFVYEDPNLGGDVGYSFWGRHSELRTTGRLFRTFDNFTLVWNATIALDTLQNGRISMTKTFDLSIGGDTFLSGNAIFDFVGDSTGTWRISRWEDESFY